MVQHWLLAVAAIFALLPQKTASGSAASVGPPFPSFPFRYTTSVQPPTANHRDPEENGESESLVSKIMILELGTQRVTWAEFKHLCLSVNLDLAPLWFGSSSVKLK